MEKELKYLSIDEILSYEDEYRDSLTVSSGTKGSYVNQLKKFTSWCVEMKIERPEEKDFIEFREKPIQRHYTTSYSGIYHFFRFAEKEGYGKDITKTIFNVTRVDRLNPVHHYTPRDRKVNTALWETTGKVIDFEDADKLLAEIPYFMRTRALTYLKEKEVYTPRDREVNTALWEITGKVIDFEDADKLLAKLPYFKRNRVLTYLKEKEENRKKRA